MNRIIDKIRQEISDVNKKKYSKTDPKEVVSKEHGNSLVVNKQKPNTVVANKEAEGVVTDKGTSNGVFVKEKQSKVGDDEEHTESNNLGKMFAQKMVLETDL